ncbi:30S ribosomal protein S5-like isoform X4 [Anthonomus grandis grandis]|uniref:30S ribosomal protein S5-like isoform X3 n=1 Tax=Anthonomus grandis grandis TaxID=2921223 RepID=UPI002165D738|nr:30S ribosomal protein S5-like isoform X3 [Anthonomus grandis grandis]XP_050313038.1 30S ribosomal protein S5-like isoform X4 [Anthonomus grandis grandis]
MKWMWKPQFLFSSVEMAEQSAIVNEPEGIAVDDPPSGTATPEATAAPSATVATTTAATTAAPSVATPDILRMLEALQGQVNALVNRPTASNDRRPARRLIARGADHGRGGRRGRGGHRGRGRGGHRGRGNGGGSNYFF